MKLLGTAVLLLGVFTSMVASMAGLSQYTYPRIISSGGCGAYTCGTNAKCTMSEGRPVCSCLNLHMGDPLVRCIRVECLINEDCPGSRACISNKCVDPCTTSSTCGVNALCETRNHVPVCRCPPTYTGDPFTACQEDPQAACKPSPCGVNTNCDVMNGVAVCKCLPGYHGSPLSGCRHECENDADCPTHLSCSANFKCESPCNCGTGANCDVVNHRAKCTCPADWLGNPYVSCQPECTYHSDCPQSKPACLYQKCTNPCANACGENANCEINGIKAVCSCPRHMTGDPFIRCRNFEPEDLCKPNPCGLNAICTPGHERATGVERPVCTCPPGHIGNALVSCQRGECLSDNECPDNRACIDYSCQNPCTGRECGPSAVCTPRRHIAVCTCPDGTRGDAVYSCNVVSGRSYNNYGRVNRYYRF